MNFKVLLAFMVLGGTLSEKHALFIEKRLKNEVVPDKLEEIIVLVREVSLEFVDSTPKKSWNVFDWFRKLSNP